MPARRRPGCKNSKQGQIAIRIRHGLGIHDGKVAQNPAGGIYQGKPHVADGAEFSKVRVGREQFDNIFRDVQVGSIFKGSFAGRSGDIVFVMVDIITAQPEGKRPEPTCIRQELRDPSTVSSQRLAEAFHDGAKKTGPGLGSCSIDNFLQQVFFIQYLILDFHAKNLIAQSGSFIVRRQPFGAQ